ncbi:MAG: hypothetical protein GY765_37025 [bacterium]|nr:hypothetical protein [bacterium]
MSKDTCIYLIKLMDIADHDVQPACPIRKQGQISGIPMHHGSLETRALHRERSGVTAPALGWEKGRGTPVRMKSQGRLGR